MYIFYFCILRLIQRILCLYKVLFINIFFIIVIYIFLLYIIILRHNFKVSHRNLFTRLLEITKQFTTHWHLSLPCTRETIEKPVYFLQYLQTSISLLLLKFNDCSYSGSERMFGQFTFEVFSVFLLQLYFLDTFRLKQ